jgi:hypothetical protein
MCPLCDREEDLRLSHFIPRALYPANLVYTNKTISGRFPAQMKQYLLCAVCEDRFNKHGESEAMKWITPNKKHFPLLAKMNLAQPVPGSVRKGVYSSAVLGVDTEKFGYFMLSILWRAAVAEWVLPDRTVTTKISLGGQDTAIKAYLLGTAPFPTDAMVMMTVCDDPFSRDWLARPNAIKNLKGFSGFEFLARGVYFHTLFGAGIPAKFRRMCCASSSDRYIFRRSCADKSVPAYTRLSATARKVGKWAKESEDYSATVQT